jgi:predicted DNA-binding WGR domain protein
MMAETNIELQACDPAANRRRAWRLQAGRDLFGAWTTEVQFGRIGSTGRTLRRAFATKSELDAFMRARLRRRASAPSRIGVAYRSVTADAASAPLLAAMGITPRDDVNTP